MKTDKRTYKKLVNIKAYERKAIYHSELYLFWKLARKMGIKRIVESGTYYGFTANRLARLFPDCEIISYEYREKRYRIALTRCKGYRAVYGNLDESMLTPDTALLIDGPKWMTAINLAHRLADKTKLLAIHDMEKFIPVLKSKFEHVKHSGNASANIRFLDKYIPRRDLKRHEGGQYYGTVLACVWGKR